MDGIHSAGRSTRALLDDDGMVSTDIRALPAADALIRVDLRPSVCAVKFYRVLWADLHAGVCETSLTAVRHIDPLFRTCVAGKLDHVDQRRRVICLWFVRLLDSLRYRRRIRCPAVRKSHSKAKPFTDDRAL